MSTDTDVYGLDDINKLLADMFKAEPTVEEVETVRVAIDLLEKTEGSLEEFMQSEQKRVEYIKQWLKDDATKSCVIPITYQSSFEGAGMGLSSQGIVKSKLERVQEAVLEDMALEDQQEERKRIDNLLYIENKEGSKEDAMNQFFNANLKLSDDDVAMDEEIKKLSDFSEDEIDKLEQQLLQTMPLERISEIAGVRRQETEIETINKMITELTTQLNNTQARFKKFVKVYIDKK